MRDQEQEQDPKYHEQIDENKGSDNYLNEKPQNERPG